MELGEPRTVQVYVDGELAHAEPLPRRSRYPELLIAAAVIGILAALSRANAAAPGRR